jgi:hypothetical protein
MKSRLRLTASTAAAGELHDEQPKAALLRVKTSAANVRYFISVTPDGAPQVDA